MEKYDEHFKIWMEIAANCVEDVKTLKYTGIDMIKFWKPFFVPGLKLYILHTTYMPTTLLPEMVVLIVMSYI